MPCQRKNQHAAGHAEALGITLLDSNQQSMHDSGTKNLCHLLTWETDAKKLIGWKESCGSEGNPCGERGGHRAYWGEQSQSLGSQGGVRDFVGWWGVGYMGV